MKLAELKGLAGAGRVSVLALKEEFSVQEEAIAGTIVVLSV